MDGMSRQERLSRNRGLVKERSKRRGQAKHYICLSRARNGAKMRSNLHPLFPIRLLLAAGYFVSWSI